MYVTKPSAATVLDTHAWHILATHLKLSERELEVARGIFADQKEATIAAELGMSPHTVRTHTERLYRKLGVHSRVELVLHVMGHYLQLKKVEPGRPATAQVGPDDGRRCPLCNRRMSLRLSIKP